MNENDDQAILALLAKIREGHVKAGDAYVFDKGEVEGLQEMLEAWRAGKAVWKVGWMASRVLIVLAATYGAWIALRNGLSG